ncbi:MAG TPA: competence/damage-inducible protein A [Thermoanaerobaculia bacterium]|nr:competence/damage-inducible protein A [Thermoanaerobaculia bacterium]
MRAAILAVGSELLGTERLDTNSLRLTETLLRHGVELRRKSVIGDVEEEIAAELRDLLPRVDLVLVTGGLGPTADDVTRDAVAAALGRSLAVDPEVLAGIERRFQRLGWQMPAVNRRQAVVIAGAEVLGNPRGSAPGMRLTAGGAPIFLFPGVPSELAGMVEEHLEPWLGPRSGGASRETAVLKVAGLPESMVEERIAPAYEEFGRQSITILAKPADVRLLATATGPPEQRQARLQAMTARLAALVGDAVYSRREEDTLESVVGGLLRAAGATLTVAESCTGGLLGERLTRVAGSSDYFLGGAITYGDRLKTAMLGVPPDVLAAHGAVSAAVARAMAEGVRARLGSDYGVAVTGVAGPGGGSEAKPVGTVHLAIAGPPPGPGQPEVEHRQLRLPGDRERVRWQASQLALDMLRRRLLAAAAGMKAAAAGGLSRRAP